MTVGFQNSIVRLSFLCHIEDIKIVWTNPCSSISHILNSIHIIVDRRGPGRPSSKKFSTCLESLLLPKSKPSGKNICNLKITTFLTTNVCYVL